MTTDGPERLGEAPGQPLAIEDYAIIGDCRTGAMVGRNGSIDWLCWPRFDSTACFAALLGDARNGSWQICPAGEITSVKRCYRGDTLVLEIDFCTHEGAVTVIDFMPIGLQDSSIVRRVTGKQGRVAMTMRFTVRFDFGASTPWVTKLDGGGGIAALAGPNVVVLRTDVELEGRDRSTFADFTVAEGETAEFTLTWGQSHLPLPDPFDTKIALAETEDFWREWSGRCKYDGPWKEQVLRSLITLKALTFAPTGGIVAALTTSLPEQLGGERNWDYRYCWLRDATLTLIALMSGGYYEEAQAWREWLHRAIAGNPDEMQIMYGIAGERTLIEWSPRWLPGYQGASPVRIGNAASEQLQLDVYGEVMGALHIARTANLPEPESAWPMQLRFIEHLLSIWQDPDDGIWEVRGGRRNFTHSKIMAWLALDRTIRDAETYGYPAPLDEWRTVRETMHAAICDKGYDASRNTFTQSFGDPALDASLLLIPIVGFLPPEDPRVIGTVAAIEQDLLVDGFVLRYRTETGADGLKPGEGAFLPCSFWLAEAYALLGRHDESHALFERLVGLANDVGLLAEEYDPSARRQVGNFPQAFSHLALIGAVLSRYNRSTAEQLSGKTQQS